MSKQRSKILESYRKSLNFNLNFIKGVLSSDNLAIYDFLEQIESLLSDSLENIAKKWEDNKKHARTELVMKGFSDDYPIKNLNISIMMDAMINILDDIYDENLEKNEKGLYIIEFLRVFATLNFEGLSGFMQDSIYKYFNRLITIPIAEKSIYKELISEDEYSKIITHSINLLNIRSVDVDFFVDAALDLSGFNDKENKLITNTFRKFRAINIFQKDINDVNHDIQSGQNTPVTFIWQNKKEKFKFFKEDIVEYYKKEMLQVKTKDLKNKKAEIVLKRIKKLFKEIKYGG